MNGVPDHLSVCAEYTFWRELSLGLQESLRLACAVDLAICLAFSTLPPHHHTIHHQLNNLAPRPHFLILACIISQPLQTPLKKRASTDWQQATRFLSTPTANIRFEVPQLRKFLKQYMREDGCNPK
jgi:hypothetical protein